jgi:hypothetical protein
MPIKTIEQVLLGCFVVALFGGCAKMGAIPAENRVYQMKEQECWTDQKTFTCITPPGPFVLDHWLLVGKGLWDMQQENLTGCAKALSDIQ